MVVIGVFGEMGVVIIVVVVVVDMFRCGADVDGGGGVAVVAADVNRRLFRLFTFFNVRGGGGDGDGDGDDSGGGGEACLITGMS